MFSENDDESVDEIVFAKTHLKPGKTHGFSTSWTVEQP